MVGPIPTQPGLLHHVLGLGQTAEHPVGDRDQQRPVLLERLDTRGFNGHVLPLIAATRHRRDDLSGPKRDIAAPAGCLTYCATLI